MFQSLISIVANTLQDTFDIQHSSDEISNTPLFSSEEILEHVENATMSEIGEGKVLFNFNSCLGLPDEISQEQVNMLRSKGYNVSHQEDNQTICVSIH